MLFAQLLCMHLSSGKIKNSWRNAIFDNSNAIVYSTYIFYLLQEFLDSAEVSIKQPKIQFHQYKVVKPSHFQGWDTPVLRLEWCHLFPVLRKRMKTRSV